MAEINNKCQIEKCKFKINYEVGEDSLYCSKHKKYYYKDKIIKEGYEVCSNFIGRGCYNKCEDVHFSRCDTCREKERIKDKELRERRRKEINDFNNINNKFKKCINCNKEKDITQFTTNINIDVLKCKDCRNDYNT
jgi:hypothetical protein